MATCKDCILYDVCCKYDMYGDCAERCKRFKNQEQFVYLPCKAGDTIYLIYSRTSNNKNFRIVEAKVERLVQEIDVDCHTSWFRVELENYISVFEWNFDKIFLTLEEAEDALKRLNAVGEARRNNE